jgi:hypothetical protein
VRALIFSTALLHRILADVGEEQPAGQRVPGVAQRVAHAVGVDLAERGAPPCSIGRENGSVVVVCCARALVQPARHAAITAGAKRSRLCRLVIRSHQGVAMQLQLTDQEAMTLRDVLQQKVTELDTEINRTDSFAFKAELRDMDRTIERVLGRLSEAVAHLPGR